MGANQNGNQPSPGNLTWRLLVLFLIRMLKRPVKVICPSSARLAFRKGNGVFMDIQLSETGGLIHIGIAAPLYL